MEADMLYRFGPCELDGETRTLLRAGRFCHVQPKVMDLLLFLVRHRARAVSHATLMRALWPDTVVSQASLTRLVKEERRLVGDDGRGQEVIRTLHCRGYRFVAEVELCSDEASHDLIRSLEKARLSLEGVIDVGAYEVRDRIQEFISVCAEVVRQAMADRALTR
jgi:DNA-binding winged helix-turn-helix (wHTH) protein